MNLSIGEAHGGASEWRAGWRVVLGAGLGMGAGASFFATAFGFFVVPLQAEFGWSRGQTALVAVSLLLTSLLMPLLGVLVDRRGARELVLFGSVAFSVSYLALAFMPGSLWAFYAILAVIGLVAAPATSPLVFTSPIIGAFDRARGAALGLGLSGSYALVFLLAPPLQAIIAHYGWRAGFLVLAALSLLLGSLSAALIGRPASAPRSHGIAPERPGVSFRAALRDPRFWLLGLAMVGSNLPLGGMISQLQPMLSDKGVALGTAALLGSWYAAAIFVGRLGVGLLLDRLWAPAVGFGALAAPAVGLLLLMPETPGLVGTVVALGFIGLAHGAEGDLLAYFVARYFGRRAFGAVFGALGLTIGVSVAAGGLTFAAVSDAMNSYAPALAGGAASMALAAVALLLTGLRRGAVAE